MSTDIFVSQASPQSPVAGIQTDKTDSFTLDQSTRPQKIRNSMKGIRDDFINTLKKVTEGRALYKRLKFSPEKSSDKAGASSGTRDMDEASFYQQPPDPKGMAVDITEPGRNDSGLSDFSGQQSKKKVAADRLPKKNKCDQKILRHQITDQIIRKAAFLLRNGQHEVIIVLKSDLLGRLRMQVISENQKVTVRIIVKDGFVKDLIEENFNLLEAELKNQDLEIGKLEVRIVPEPEASGKSQDRNSKGINRQDRIRHPEPENQKDEQPKESEPPSRTANNAANVDYFA